MRAHTPSLQTKSRARYITPLRTRRIISQVSAPKRRRRKAGRRRRRRSYRSIVPYANTRTVPRGGVKTTKSRAAKDTPPYFLYPSYAAASLCVPSPGRNVRPTSRSRRHRPASQRRKSSLMAGRAIVGDLRSKRDKRNAQDQPRGSSACVRPGEPAGKSGRLAQAQNGLRNCKAAEAARTI